jgi:predicted nucleic acid-binding protein
MPTFGCLPRRRIECCAFRTARLMSPTTADPVCSTEVTHVAAACGWHRALSDRLTELEAKQDGLTARLTEVPDDGPDIHRGNDLLIAAQAKALGYTVVTDNEREFAHVTDVPRENWLRDS